MTIVARKSPTLQSDNCNVSGEMPGKLTDLGRDGLYLFTAQGEKKILVRCVRIEGVKPPIWFIPAGDSLAYDIARALLALAGGGR